MKKICISQPIFHPYLGFFDKLIKTDIWVVLDIVKVNLREFQTRNRIRDCNPANKQGWVWLNIPIRKQYRDKPLNQVNIFRSNWDIKHLKTIWSFYHKAPFFDDYYDDLSFVYTHKPNILSEFNLNLIKLYCGFLNINTKIIKASDLNINKKLKGTDLLVELVKTVGGDSYFSGALGKGYIEEEKFEREEIKLEYQNYVCKKYKQLCDPFIPYMSVMDLCFNEGKEGREFI